MLISVVELVFAEGGESKDVKILEILLTNINQL